MGSNAIRKQGVARANVLRVVGATGVRRSARVDFSDRTAAYAAPAVKTDSGVTPGRGAACASRDGPEKSVTNTAARARSDANVPKGVTAKMATATRLPVLVIATLDLPVLIAPKNAKTVDGVVTAFPYVNAEMVNATQWMDLVFVLLALLAKIVKR